MNRESQDNTLSEGIVLQGMFEDGMSLGSFEMTLRWLYNGTYEDVQVSDSEEVMKLIAMANLLGLKSLVQVCELQLSNILAKNPLLAQTYFDLAER